MADEARCPHCGAVLDPIATADGVCTVCLLKLALADVDTTADGVDTTAAVTRLLPKPTPTDRAPVEPGRRLGAYRLLKVLGRGGFGVVWEAEHVDTGRRLALKVLTTLRVTSPDAFARFEREGRLAASLNHPHCVFVFGAEEIDGYPTVSMELMVGGTLQEEIKKHGRISPMRCRLRARRHRWPRSDAGARDHPP
jgi:serine/threonine protein kinase